MKMMHTMASKSFVTIPKRRFYSPELKRQVVAETKLPGASVAGVALAHGINANIVHRWIRELASFEPAAPQGFVALTVQSAEPAQPGTDPGNTEIRIELRRSGTVVNIAWPVAQAGECAAWMRELLR
jgi:transposase